MLQNNIDPQCKEKVTNEQAYRGAKYYDLIAVAFVSLLIVSNIVATKLIGLDFGVINLIFDGGAICFPFTYILGDVLSEVYGFKASKRVIVTGFIVSVVASTIFYIVQLSPVGPGYENQAAYEAVLGFVPRIVLASLTGYFVGQILNSIVLVKIKARFGEEKLWVRLVFSTLVGEAADTIIFCTIAFYGVITGAEFLNYCITGYVYKCLLEIVMLPLTYKVISWVKKHEIDYYTLGKN
ncbi:queuosine precursor transporter [Actinomyces sp. zg-332]|uniref:queuosine precursor transporter n=1 Tax=Actinomyces sp. zg-332 TaxID=2708340 RepID=UPI0014200916|nr:queuosine precursor transporter [Actinomyces sp. zg-332]QPK94561.1 queuosine precursor transporter [Actinomyces sp. zg-332]